MVVFWGNYTLYAAIDFLITRGTLAPLAPKPTIPLVCIDGFVDPYLTHITYETIEV
jgi:hypothetical protein